MECLPYQLAVSINSMLIFWESTNTINTPFHVFQMTQFDQFAKELVYQLSIVNLKISRESGQISGNS